MLALAALFALLACAAPAPGDIFAGPSFAQPLARNSTGASQNHAAFQATARGLSPPLGAQPSSDAASDPEAAVRFALLLRARATPAEQRVPLALLRPGPGARDAAGGAAAGPGLPGAPWRLPGGVPQRRRAPGARRLQRLVRHVADECHRQTTPASCEDTTNDECVPCVWRPEEDPQCVEPRCDHYQDEPPCCANELLVQSGCIWHQDRCIQYQCWPLNMSDCSADPNCNFTGGCGCIDVTSECRNSSVVDPRLKAAVAWSCPPMDCAMCLKNSGDADARIPWNSQPREDSCKDVRAARAGACQARCQDAAHCDGELDCLLHHTKKLDPCMRFACPSAEPVRPWLCGSRGRSATTSTTTAWPSACGPFCVEVDDQCGECGQSTCCETATALTDGHCPRFNTTSTATNTTTSSRTSTTKSTTTTSFTASTTTSTTAAMRAPTVTTWWTTTTTVISVGSGVLLMAVAAASCYCGLRTSVRVHPAQDPADQMWASPRFTPAEQMWACKIVT